MICVYTDGGCSFNPGPGGWAYVVIGNGESGIGSGERGIGSGQPCVLAEKWGGEKSTTNNRMELQAVIAALEDLPSMRLEDKKVTVYTDSQYVQKGMTLWMGEWKKKGWKTSGKEPVKNQDLWQRLDALASALVTTGGFSLNWAWVKGHAGNEYNERCDALTQKAIASL